jgi:hypothetical protein
MQLDVYDIMIKTLVNMWDALKADPVFLIFLIAIVVIAFLKAIKSPVSRKEKGAYGEKHIEIELNRLSLFGRNGKKLRNIYIPKDDGSTSEIDVLYITQKGIFVFESKNCSGWIFGKESDQYWTVSLPNGQKNKLYNPIRQNRSHIKWLKNYLGKDIPMYSIIVFSDRCELKKMVVESSDVRVIKWESLYSTVREIWDSVDDANIDVDGSYENLEKLTNVDEAVKAAHVESIQNRYGG